MHSSGHAFSRTARGFLAVAFALAALAPAPSADAQPTEPTATENRAATTAREISGVAVEFPGARASLETSRPSIATGSRFGFRVRVSASGDAGQAWVRFRVRRPAGRLIYQRTRVLTLDAPGSIETFFERETGDLDLAPGAYPVEADVSISDGSTTREATLQTRLLVFDAARPRLPVVLAARVSGQPLSDPQGRFVSDPGSFTRARDDVRDLAHWVLESPHARLTLSVPPLLLEEWNRIAQGYEFASPEGLAVVDAKSAVPREYAEVLDLLARAAATGRLELVSTGYSDPSLSDLAAAGMTPDVVPQYAQGLSATYASLETTPSTGTVPAGGCIPADAVAGLVRAGVRYAVVDSVCTKAGESTATPTSHRSNPRGLTVLVSDAPLSTAVRAGDASAAVGLAFTRAIDDELFGPLTIVSDFGPGGADVDTFTDVADVLAYTPWVGLRTARDAVSPTRRTAHLLAARATEGAPTGYWQEVNTARRWADALLDAVGEGAADAVTARRDSFIAQASAWAGPDASWAVADRGRTFAATAKRLADATLGAVSLAMQPITLAGAQGNVPVTVRNTGERPLDVTLRARASGGARLAGSQVTTIALGPAETFLEIPIDLRQAVSGRLTVDIVAGDVVLDTATVDVRASYLDRIATVGGVVALLGILLAYIIRRVRNAERLDPSE